jgi:hypothetical protein
VDVLAEFRRKMEWSVGGGNEGVEDGRCPSAPWLASTGERRPSPETARWRSGVPMQPFRPRGHVSGPAQPRFSSCNDIRVPVDRPHIVLKKEDGSHVMIGWPTGLHVLSQKKKMVYTYMYCSSLCYVGLIRFFFFIFSFACFFSVNFLFLLLFSFLKYHIFTLCFLWCIFFYS